MTDDSPISIVRAWSGPTPPRYSWGISAGLPLGSSWPGDASGQLLYLGNRFQFPFHPGSHSRELAGGYFHIQPAPAILRPGHRHLNTRVEMSPGRLTGGGYQKPNGLRPPLCWSSHQAPGSELRAFGQRLGEGELGLETAGGHTRRIVELPSAGHPLADQNEAGTVAVEELSQRITAVRSALVRLVGQGRVPRARLPLSPRTPGGLGLEGPLVLDRSRHTSDAILPATLAAWVSISHCQTTTGRQPSFFSSDNFWRSRRTFASNLSFQYSRLERGMVASGQHRWRCQKHPCTNIASRGVLKTMSGLPGKSRALVENRSPRLRNSRCRSRSGPVSERPTAFMMRERSGVVAGGRLGSRATIAILAVSRRVRRSLRHTRGSAERHRRSIWPAPLWSPMAPHGNRTNREIPGVARPRGVSACAFGRDERICRALA